MWFYDDKQEEDSAGFADQVIDSFKVFVWLWLIGIAGLCLWAMLP